MHAFGTYLAIGFVSLAANLYFVNRRRVAQPRGSGAEALSVAAACGGALLLLIPLFYIHYLSELPHVFTAGPPFLPTLYRVFVLGWAHFAAYAWSTGQRWPERDLPGITFVLVVPSTLVLLFRDYWLSHCREATTLPSLTIRPYTTLPAAVALL